MVLLARKAVLSAALVLPACSRRTPVAEAATPASPVAAQVAAGRAVRSPRSVDPDVVKLRRALDFGQADEARALLPALERLDGPSKPEAPLLSARLSALSRDTIEAIRAIETARKERPLDPDVYATAAEIYAAAGKLEAGWDEVKAGQAACGQGPELSRARGVLWISRSGGARKGLELLEAARRDDPDLPFVDRALSQAHLLVGKEDAAARKTKDALEHARQAATLDPGDVDAQRFLSEALVLGGDFEGGVLVIQALVDRGQPLGAELALLHKKAAIGALLERDRPRAVVHFAAARKLGLTDAELSTGARVLDEEAGKEVEKGVADYQAGNLDAAKAEFRAALELDPDRVQAKNSLAVVLFRQADYAGAVDLWKQVLETARKEDLALPEPVHINLSKAQAQAGDLDGARATLERYLSGDPTGKWAAETRSALSALPVRKTGE
jgi:tetratricopeptide (TPR) repeat protein